MNFQSLLEKYDSQEVFIYGKSVIQIVDMDTYTDDQTLKTDFIYHTDRNRRGVITIEHQDKASENLALTIKEKQQSKQKKQ